MMNTYEIYTTKFSQIIKAKSAFLALQAFAQANPSEDVLCIEDVRMKDRAGVSTGFYCSDELADFLTELQATQTKYFALRRQNSPDAGKVLDKSKENETRLRKFLADRAAQKAQKEKEISQPTLF